MANFINRQQAGLAVKQVSNASFNQPENVDMKQQIKHRYSGKVLFECECEDGDLNPVKTTVEAAVKAGARLDGASLVGARLDGALLVGARLDGASLDGALLVGARLDGALLVGASLDGARLDGARLDGALLVGALLDGARLDGARLDPIKADFWMVLLSATPEIAGLRLALVEGRVDGSTYQGDCACLVGTIANVRKANYQDIGIKPDSSRAAERWFMGIKKGDKPETNQVSKLTVEWLDDFVVKLNFAKESI